MKKKILCVILLSILVCFAFTFFGCQKKDVPRTLEDVERLTREKFFDENGEPILTIWTNLMKDKPEEIEKLNITGFTCSKIKDVTTGKEIGYWVEFDNMGYKYGKLGSNYSSGYANFFSYKESPFKKWDIEQERRYVNLYNGSVAPFVGIMTDGIILSAGTYENIQNKNMRGSFNAYDPEKKEWLIYDTISEWLESKEK